MQVIAHINNHQWLWYAQCETDLNLGNCAHLVETTGDPTAQPEVF